MAKASNYTGAFVNYYDVLQCERTATSEDLKKSYQNLVRSYHPDKLSAHVEQDETFLLVQKAWTVLRDPSLRKQYDAILSCEDYSDCLLHDVVDISELRHESGEDCYKYPCRCGGIYLVQSSDLESPKVTIACDECSFSIQINVPEVVLKTGDKDNPSSL